MTGPTGVAPAGHRQAWLWLCSRRWPDSGAKSLGVDLPERCGWTEVDASGSGAGVPWPLPPSSVPVGWAVPSWGDAVGEPSGAVGGRLGD